MVLYIISQHAFLLLLVQCMGGQESTLLTMLPPLFHHGMMILGLHQTLFRLCRILKQVGLPMAPSHVSGPRHDQSLSQDEKFYVRFKGSV